MVKLGQSRYMKAVNTPKPLLLTIRDCTSEVVGEDNAQERNILWFEETEQGLVLNLTNENFLVSYCQTQEADEMAGEKVVVYAADVDFKGKTVQGLRLRAPKKAYSEKIKEEVEQLEEEGEGDVPF